MLKRGRYIGSRTHLEVLPASVVRACERLWLLNQNKAASLGEIGSLVVHHRRHLVQLKRQINSSVA